MRRNLTKARDTARLMEEIADEKLGHAAVVRIYQQVRMRYELLLATTIPDRWQLIRMFFRALPGMRTGHEGAKIFVRVGLALVLGPERCHRIIENLKS